MVNHIISYMFLSNSIKLFKKVVNIWKIITLRRSTTVETTTKNLIMDFQSEFRKVLDLNPRCKKSYWLKFLIKGGDLQPSHKYGLSFSWDKKIYLNPYPNSLCRKPFLGPIWSSKVRIIFGKKDFI